MAPLKSTSDHDLRPGGSHNLKDAVDPTLRVWGTLKESARITRKLWTLDVVGMVVLFTSVFWALDIFRDIYDDSEDCIWRIAIDIPRLAAINILYAVVQASVARAVLEAYNPENAGSSTSSKGWHRFVECLKARFDRKLLEATLRTLGTELANLILCIGFLVLVVLVIACAALLFLLWPVATGAFVVLVMVPGIDVSCAYLITSLYLSATACILEPETWGVRAVARSYKLLNGHIWKAIGLVLIYNLFDWFLFTYLFEGLVKPSTGMAAAMLMTSLRMALWTPFQAFSQVVFTVFYLKCRAAGNAVNKNVELDSEGHQHRE